jgi:hypothetical protein
MSMKVQLTAQQEAEVEKLKQLPFKAPLAGECASCHRGIPLGYVPHVTKWRVRDYGGLRTQEPSEMFCSECVGMIDVPKSKRQRILVTPPPEGSTAPEKVLITPPPESKLGEQELMAKLFAVTHPVKPRGWRKLARLAKLGESDLANVEPILKKLLDIGKVKLVEGRWVGNKPLKGVA